MIKYDPSNPIHVQTGYYSVEGEPEYWTARSGPLSGVVRLQVNSWLVFVYGYGKLTVITSNGAKDFTDAGWNKAISAIACMAGDDKSEEFMKFLRGVDGFGIVSPGLYCK